MDPATASISRRLTSYAFVMPGMVDRPGRWLGTVRPRLCWTRTSVS